MLIGRAAETDVHMRGVVVPRPHQAQPGPVTLGGFAQLPLDRWIDQDAVDVGQTRREMQHGHHVRRPARQVNASLIRPYHAWQLDRLALRRSQSALRRDIQPDVDIETELVAKVATWQRPTARARNVLDIEIAQACRMDLLAQLFDAGDGRWRAPERTPVQVNRLKANPRRRQTYRTGDAPGGLATDDVERSGRRTSCRRRRTKQCDSQQAPQLAKFPAQGRPPRSESTLEHRDDIAGPYEVLPGGPALHCRPVASANN